MQKDVNLQKTKIVFMGTGKLALPVLEKLLKEKYSVVSVITKNDKKIGTGEKRKIAENPVKNFALENKINLLQPEKLDENFVEEIKEINPDLIVVICYGKIIPEKILQIPKFGAINIHTSLLPKLRGASPVQNAILNGWNDTGITIMKMDKGMDSGNILAQKKVEIEKDDTNETLSAKIFSLGAKFLIEILPNYLNGEIVETKQDENQVTYCKILKKEDGKIDWNKTAQESYNQFRAFNPWPGVFTFWNKDEKKKVRIKLNQIKIGENCLNLNLKIFKIGQIFENEKKIYVATKEGFVEIFELQIEGKSSMKIKDFLNGNKNFIGSILE